MKGNLMTNQNETSLTKSRGRRRLAYVLGSALALTGLVGAAHVAQARPHGGHGFGPGAGLMGRGMMRMLDRLDLSESQELTAVRMRRALREEGKLLRQAARADMKEVAEELKKPDPDRAKILSLVDANATRMKAMAEKVTNQLLDFHAQLTPAQKAEVAQMIEKRQARMAERKKRFE